MANSTGNEAFKDEDKLVGKDCKELTDETHEVLRNYFGVELGLSVRRLGIMPISRRVTIPINQQCLFIPLSTLPSIVRTANMDQCAWYKQKGNTCLMCFRFDDGERYFAVRTTPTILDIKLVDNSDKGVGILIGSTPRTEAVQFLINMCIIDRYTCFCCGESSLKMKCCQKCQAKNTCTRYCSLNCQRMDWRYHKRVCGK